MTHRALGHIAARSRLLGQLSPTLLTALMAALACGGSGTSSYGAGGSDKGVGGAAFGGASIGIGGNQAGVIGGNSSNLFTGGSQPVGGTHPTCGATSAGGAQPTGSSAQSGSSTGGRAANGGGFASGGTAGGGLTIEAYDFAVVSNTTFQDIRVEAADSMLINLALDLPPSWRTAVNTGVYKDTHFTNVSSGTKKVVAMHGKSANVNITGVHFKSFTVQGNAVTSRTDADAWNINSYVSGIDFQ